MPERRARAGAALLVALAAASCARVRTLGPNRPLFGGEAPIRRLDFETDRVAAPPKGFRDGGDWKVVDSPTAASGEQVLVRRGESASRLPLAAEAGTRHVAAEASVRVLVGDGGAGLSCRAEGGDAGWRVALERGAGRVALYRESAERAAVVGSRRVDSPREDWTRLGLLCGGDRVVGYLNGKPIGVDAAALGGVDVALWSDGGVVAQFDDVRFSGSK